MFRWLKKNPLARHSLGEKNDDCTLPYPSLNSEASIHQHLSKSMRLYRFLNKMQQDTVCRFVKNFYRGKDVFTHRDIQNSELLMMLTAANAALVGAAQNTHYFSSVKWIYFCGDDLDVDGDAYEASRVRLNAVKCLEESKRVFPGNNVVVHEFAHILDNIFALSGSTKGLRDGYEQFLEDQKKGYRTPIAEIIAGRDPAVSGAVLLDDMIYETEKEYFAGASEAFFTNARQLRRYNAQLYLDLSAIYGLHLADLNWEAIHAG